jgi:hypothetical protein
MLRPVLVASLVIWIAVSQMVAESVFLSIILTPLLSYVVATLVKITTLARLVKPAI